MKKIIFVLALAFQVSAFAALPPLWQNVAELKAILEDKRLGETLQSGEVIMDIQHSESSWLIVTNHSKVAVKVTYKEAKMPGPAQFNLEFGIPEKL